MVKRAMTDSYPGRWEYPGGKVDPGETAWQALVREVKEETGLDIQVISFVTRNEWFCMMKDPRQEVKLSPEHSDYKWIDN